MVFKIVYHNIFHPSIFQSSNFVSLSGLREFFLLCDAIVVYKLKLKLLIAVFCDTIYWSHIFVIMTGLGGIAIILINILSAYYILI